MRARPTGPTPAGTGSHGYLLMGLTKSNVQLLSVLVRFATVLEFGSRIGRDVVEPWLYPNASGHFVRPMGALEGEMSVPLRGMLDVDTAALYSSRMTRRAPSGAPAPRLVPFADWADRTRARVDLALCFASPGETCAGIEAQLNTSLTHGCLLRLNLPAGAPPPRLGMRCVEHRAGEAEVRSLLAGARSVLLMHVDRLSFGASAGDIGRYASMPPPMPSPGGPACPRALFAPASWLLPAAMGAAAETLARAGASLGAGVSREGSGGRAPAYAAIHVRSERSQCYGLRSAEACKALVACTADGVSHAAAAARAETGRAEDGASRSASALPVLIFAADAEVSSTYKQDHADCCAQTRAALVSALGAEPLRAGRARTRRASAAAVFGRAAAEHAARTLDARHARRRASAPTDAATLVRTPIGRALVDALVLAHAAPLVRVGGGGYGQWAQALRAHVAAARAARAGAGEDGKELPSRPACAPPSSSPLRAIERIYRTCRNESELTERAAKRSAKHPRAAARAVGAGAGARAPQPPSAVAAVARDVGSGCAPAPVDAPDCAPAGGAAPARGLTLVFFAGVEGSGHHWPWRAALAAEDVRHAYSTDRCLVHAFWASSVSANATLRRAGEDYLAARLARLADAERARSGSGSHAYFLNGAPAGYAKPPLPCEPGADVPWELWHWSKGGKLKTSVGQMSYPAFGLAEAMPDLRLLGRAACRARSRVTLGVAAIARHPAECMVSTTLHRRFGRGDAARQARMLKAGAHELEAQLRQLAQWQRSRALCARVIVMDHSATLARPAEAARRLAATSGLSAPALEAGLQVALGGEPREPAPSSGSAGAPSWLREARAHNASAEWLGATRTLLAELRGLRSSSLLFAHTRFDDDDAEAESDAARPGTR